MFTRRRFSVPRVKSEPQAGNAVGRLDLAQYDASAVIAVIGALWCGITSATLEPSDVAVIHQSLT